MGDIIPGRLGLMRLIHQVTLQDTVSFCAFVHRNQSQQSHVFSVALAGP